MVVNIDTTFSSFPKIFKHENRCFPEIFVARNKGFHEIFDSLGANLRSLWKNNRDEHYTCHSDSAHMIHEGDFHIWFWDVGKTAPNVIDRDFTADRPLQKVATDVTKINIGGSKIYLSTVLDMFNGEIYNRFKRIYGIL